MPSHRLPVVDADGHVYETDRELSEHFEGRYRELRRLGTFPLFPTLDGWPRALSAPDSSPGVTPEVWRSFLDEAGIGQAVLYPTAGLALGLIQKTEWAIALARAYNNWLTERYLRADPAFRGVALLPVHDVPAAVAELEHAVTSQGMVAGLLPANNVLHKSYGHPDFHPLYAAAERLDVPLVIHGAPSQGLGFDHFDNFIKVHTLEHPVAIMIQCTSIILDGVLELFPRLRLGFLEAGCGWVPYMLDRLDYEFEAAWGRDAALLRQLIMILMDNAVKFNVPGGRVEMRLTGGDGLCRVRVGSSGSEISAEEQAGLFGRFFSFLKCSPGGQVLIHAVSDGQGNRPAEEQ
jgi:predicted TIM-barrel fold metal-dependent hydrolase